MATVRGDTLRLRGIVRLSEFGGREALGALGAMLGERTPVEFAGLLDVVRPGLAQYRLTMVRIGGQELPRPLIPRIVSRIGRTRRPEGVAADALPLGIPEHIGDVRVSDGRITLIKSGT
jgi:hypothetical protein